MDIDALRKRFPTEEDCRRFFENVLWEEGRTCPRCLSMKSYPLKSRKGLYECAHCKRQFTVTCQTPMHSTKLPLWKWLLAMFLLVTSSKGLSSISLGKWIGISQKSAWKMGHAIRQMMDVGDELLPALNGINKGGFIHAEKQRKKSEFLLPLSAAVRFGPLTLAMTALMNWSR